MKRRALLYLIVSMSFSLLCYFFAGFYCSMKYGVREPVLHCGSDRISMGWKKHICSGRPEHNDSLHHCSTEIGEESIEFGLFSSSRSFICGVTVAPDTRFGMVIIKDTSIFCLE